MVGTVFATEDFVAVNRAGGSDFYVFASLEPGEDASVRLQRKARQVEESLRGSLDEAFGARIHKRIGVFVGHALLRPNPQMRVERLVYRALRQAIAVATTKEEERQTPPARDLQATSCASGRIRTVYQPIFQLETLELFGHEALTRGPADTAFESPELLFQFAGENEADLGARAALPRRPRRRTTRRRSPGQLFINVEADTIARAVAERPAGRSRRSSPRSTRSSSRSPSVRRSATCPSSASALATLRELGFRIAIDDAGSGYASLQAIAELKPDFIKVANTLITGLRTRLDQARRRRDARQPRPAASTPCASPRASRRPRTSRSAGPLGIPTARASTSASRPRRPPPTPAREFTGRIRTAR